MGEDSSDQLTCQLKVAGSFEDNRGKILPDWITIRISDSNWKLEEFRGLTFEIDTYLIRIDNPI